MTNKIAVVFAVVSTSLIIFIAYQALVVVPNKRIDAERSAATAKLQAEEMERFQKKINYDACISEAYSNYSTDWDNTCINIGKQADCSLLPYQYQRAEETHKEAQDRCVLLYK